MRRHWVLSVVALACAIGFVVAVTHGRAPAAAPASLTIQVTGTPGVQWEGSYATASLSAGESGTSVSGKTPDKLTVSTPSVLVFSAQNQGASGTLTVTVLEGTKVLQTATTSAPYGVASVSVTV